MRPRRVIEDVLVPAVIVAAPPATVTQKNCFDCFGISPADYLRFAGRGAFPVRVDGKMRIARYADVEAYLTGGAKPVPPSGPGPKPAKTKGAPDLDAVLYKAGFR